MFNKGCCYRSATNWATSGRTAVVTGYGPAASVLSVLPSGLRIQTRPDPDSVRIRVRAASVNPLDLMMRQGYGRSVFEGQRHDRFPFGLGLDCVGTVESVGSLVQQFAEGDRVMAVNSPIHHTGRGTWCELVDIPVSLVDKAPAHLDDYSAAAIPFAAMTAASSIPSRSIHRAVIIGASGGVGLFALQMLKHRGARVIAVASEPNSSICYDYGADLFLDYAKDDIASKIDKNSVDFVLDASGNKSDSSSIEPYLASLRQGATYTTLSSPFINSCDSYNNFAVGASLAAMRLIRSKIQYQDERNINFEWAFFNPCPTTWKKVVDLSASGRLKSHVSKVFPLEEITAAHDYMERGHVPGKIVIAIGKDSDFK